MSLINANDPLPQYLIVMLRYFAHAGGEVRVERAKSALCPPTLKDQTAFESALKSLESLGVVKTIGDQLVLVDAVSTDTAQIADTLRRAVLAEGSNAGLGEDASQVGPRDLTRALCWFLTLDPVTDALNWIDVQARQENSIKVELGNPIVNDTRWNPFCSWSCALGLCTPALNDGASGSRLTPDCTTAVRSTIQKLWSANESVHPHTALRELRRALPVLPGGKYSTAVGIDSPGSDHAGPALSFALLRGHDEKWLRLEQNDDAQHVLHLEDPDQPEFPRTFSSITVLEAHHG